MKNEPVRPPDLHGAGGQRRAWLTNISRRVPKAKRETTVVQWLVEAPGGRPLWSWSWYIVACVHLREVKGAPAPSLHFPGATHELIMVALDPAARLPSVEAWGRPGTPQPRILMPLDQCVQFIVADDEQAAVLTVKCVEVIMAGMTPDSDFRGWWGEAVASTAEHIRLGGHPG
jgi:hypothetical protein